MSDETFEVEGSTDKPISNVLEKGRYKFKVKDIQVHKEEKRKEEGKPKCLKLEMIVSGVKVIDYLILTGQMSYKWKQFLFAIGIRDKRKNFNVDKDIILKGEGMVDIGVKDRVYDDGSTMQENRVYSYSPIQEEIAPISGVEPEQETKETPKAEEPKQEEQKKDELEDI